MLRSGQFRVGFRSALLAGLAAGALTIHQAEAAEARALNLPGGSLEGALAALAAQTGDQLVYTPDLVAGRRVGPLVGRYDLDSALARLLASSDVVAVHAAPGMIVLKRRDAATARTTVSAAPGPGGAPVPTHPIESALMAGAATDTPQALAQVEAKPTASSAATVGEVLVTGTHIRGGSPAAPLLLIDRQAIENSGYATVAEALQALPQNFGGQDTEATVGVHADTLHTNSGYGTGVNLRGLGSDSTLILVDGRRLSGSGNKGDFSDISGIPAIAVQRVEVLLDGASALYGSDAVGGVVNFILRKDLEGGEIHVRAGTGGDGPQEQLASVAFGHAWNSGNVIVAYEGYHRDALPASARDFTATSDLRGLGGTDFRLPFSYPGNILRTDPVSGLATPFWAIPAGQSGVGLKPTDFQAGVTNLYNQNLGIDILPDERRQSGYVAFHQDLTPSLTVSGDARYSYRNIEAATSGLTSTLTVSSKNPFFVSPNGATSNQIDYAFNDEEGDPRTHVGNGALTGSFGADLKLPGDWRTSAYGAFAQNIIHNTQTGNLQSTILSEALGNTADNPGTAFNAARDGFFNPYSAVPGVNSAATLAAITSGFVRTYYRTQVTSANVEGDGTVIQLPGGPLKLALGAQVRKETFDSKGTTYTFGVAPTAARPISADRTVSAIFAEAQLPLVGPENRLPGVEELAVSAAVRAERYSDFGDTVNPRLSAQWTPIDGIHVRGTYGQSFRAPSLVDINTRPLNSPFFATVNGAQLLTLSLQGGNPNLRPETAKSWTFGLDYEPVAVPGMKLSADWFQTDFRNRIAAPLFGAARTAILTDPTLSAFVQPISPATNAADLAKISALLASPATNNQFGIFPTNQYVAIVDLREVNTAGLNVRGIDLMGSYQQDAFGGHVTYAANASWMLDYKQALTPTSPFVDLVGQPGFPSRFRGRVNADWERGPFGVGLALSAHSGEKDSLGLKADAQATLDLALHLKGKDGTPWAGTMLTLSVRNLFDQAPPFYDNSLGVGYDPTTGDPIGRFTALELTHRW